MEINAKVVGVMPIESGTSANGEWKRATVIVEYADGYYVRKVALVNMRRAEEFAAIPVGATGTFDININSREYQGKFYTTVDCWRWNLDAAQTQQAPVPQPAPAPQPAAAQQAYTAPAPGGDDLPF